MTTTFKMDIVFNAVEDGKEINRVFKSLITSFHFFEK